MTLTQKLTRSMAAAPAKDILASDPESVASGEKEKEDDGNSESKKREKKNRNGSADPQYCPRATRTRKMRTKKKISVTL